MHAADLWHFGRSTYVPDWYAVGCLAMDVSLALYLVVRIPRWRDGGADREPRRGTAEVAADFAA